MNLKDIGIGNPDRFGKAWHDKDNPSHSNKYGHYCWDWDGLYICEDCHEFTACSCPKGDPDNEKYFQTE